MTRWFDQSIVETGRLPLFIMLVAFILTFLFIRLSVRMIRAEVSWWPGNVTPGGVHMHHEFFGVLLMLGSGFCFVALSSFETPIANVILAAVFGIGCALVLDEFALLLHLRDVYWEEEGRASIDAVFVAIAIGVLFLLGFRPLGVTETITGFEESSDVGTRIGLIIALVANVLLAAITVLKGKLWTGLVGLFIPPLLLIGSIRVARPRSPWARWRYIENPRKQAKAIDRERRFRQPLTRWKVVVQEVVAGRFGLPAAPASLPVTPEVVVAPHRAPARLASWVRWRRTRHLLGTKPPWRLPMTCVTVAIIAGLIASVADASVDITSLDAGETATLLGVIAGAMATLTGLVFTAVTLAMQFGAAQISVRVIPMFQQDPVMRWSTGIFLATFAFTLIIALDLATTSKSGSVPGISTGIALVLTLLSVYLFIRLTAKVGSILNSSQLLRWIEAEGRGAINRLYPDEIPTGLSDHIAADVPADPDAERTIVQFRDVPPDGRVILAIDLARVQRLAVKWGVRIDLLVGTGDFVPHNVGMFEVIGDADRIHPRQLLACVLFGDTHRPEVSPAAALQAISDVALKALSPAINDPSRAVQALNHIEDLLLMLSPRLLADERSESLSMIRGYRRSWADYVAIGTDQIRHYGSGSVQVGRRLRALFENLIEQCPDEQDPPLVARLQALDEAVPTVWTTDLDQRLARGSDVQGLGSEEGRALGRRLSINTDVRGPHHRAGD
ncbi:DUF2254 family protein [Gordonia sp. CPCC 205515]|uniref:DUF2254 family protein n=1 Tax=Gordonia sp. CPCC 205515 TaxID=3140791 RepID=UPI003AF3FF16